MNRKKIQSVISALTLYGTERERRFAELTERYLKEEGRLTEQQELELENLHREKTRWIKYTITAMKARQNSISPI